MPPVSSRLSSSVSPLPATLDPALKHLVVIRSDKSSSSSLSSKPVAIKIQKLPLVTAGGERALTPSVFKAQLMKQVDGSGDHQPRIVKMSKGMLDSMLKTVQRTTVISQPAALNAGGGDDGMATPQSSDIHQEKRKHEEAELPDTGSQCYFHAKRPRMTEHDAPQLSQTGLVPKTESRAASQRVLHLYPEFQATHPEEKTPSPPPDPDQESLVLTPPASCRDATAPTLTSSTSSTSSSPHLSLHIPQVSLPQVLTPHTPLPPSLSTSHSLQVVGAVSGLITPEEGLTPVTGVRSTGGLPPSTAIINLIPHLTEGESPADLLTTSHHLPLTLLTHKQTAPPRLCHTQQQRPSLSPGGGILTPQTPTCLPSSSSSSALTPSTYFRSTPGGFFQLTTIPQVMVASQSSPFQPLEGSGSRVVGHPARRLALVEGDNNTQTSYV